MEAINPRWRWEKLGENLTPLPQLVRLLNVRGSALDQYLKSFVDKAQGDLGIYNIKMFGDIAPNTNILTVLLAAMAGVSAAGGGILTIPNGTYFVSATYAIPANVVIMGMGRGVTIIKRQHAGDMVSAIGAKAGLRHITLDGNDVAYPVTGRGVTFSAAVGAQLFFDAEIINFPLSCIDFAVPDSGSEFKSVGCTYYTSGALGFVAAVKVSGTDTQAVPRHFYETTSQGCTLFDFGGCNDFFASSFYTNGFKFSPTASKVCLSNFRCGAAAGRQTISGGSHQFGAGVFAVPITLDASTSGVNLGDCEIANWDVIDLGVNNRFDVTADYNGVVYPAAWTSDGAAPALGNGILTGIITRKGRKVRVNLRFVMGSTSALGTGQYFFSLPWLDYSAYRFLGTVWVQKTGTLVISTGVAKVIPGQQKVSAYFNGSATPLSAAQPVAWVAGDEMNLTLDYTAR